MVAGLCSTALDRALLYEAEHEARRTLEFLAAGTQLMISAIYAGFGSFTGWVSAFAPAGGLVHRLPGLMVRGCAGWQWPSMATLNWPST